MNSLDWARYNYLRERIAQAVDDAVLENGGWDEGGITIAVSPDLTEVVAGFVPWWELGNVDGWSIECAHSEDEVDEIAKLWFDFRM